MAAESRRYKPRIRARPYNQKAKAAYSRRYKSKCETPTLRKRRSGWGTQRPKLLPETAVVNVRLGVA